ncbi:hypothetical protein I314_01787 [Cryptococcus bacillisporus CA1873]|uniref:Uncharacterized protein n=2 Tax=Cryptococcus gattii TaxID=552467 RepID=A0A0D0VUH3_CRYGA|nr:hypothetical protein I312_01214 [Cryptococcus bacillisporus CA1280]KIR68289.1 hypothetical protein I314_01787 [Cryptococcus bacillisporus CA1873]|eukprot:KIR68289.1 hypothetical protein I314_01787 [Cryptococcus gattii CA1873]
MTRATPKLVSLRSLWFGSISVVSISLTPFFTLIPLKYRRFPCEAKAC